MVPLIQEDLIAPAEDAKLELAMMSSGFAATLFKGKL